MPTTPHRLDAQGIETVKTSSSEALSVNRDLARQSEAAADFLKLLASPTRLLLLCHVADQEVSVGTLAELTGMRMPTVSQQLSQLRAHGIVQTRREGTTIYYRRNSAPAQDIMSVLMKHFCPPDTHP